MVNSANVKSLLMRLHLESQGNAGPSPTADQMSFAKNLDDSLGQAYPAKSESGLRAATQQKTEAALPTPQFLGSTDAALKDESENTKPAEGPVMERPLQQDVSVKEIGGGSSSGIDVAIKKTALAVPALSPAVSKEKTELEKPKVHKGNASSQIDGAGAGVSGISEAKPSAIDQSQQSTFVDTRQSMTNLSLIQQPVAADASGTDKSDHEMPVAVQGIKISGDAITRKAAASTTRVNAGATESRKSKDAGSADVDVEQVNSVVASRAQASASSERDEAPVLAKVTHVIEGVHAVTNADLTPASVNVAFTAGSGEHELVGSKSTMATSHAELAQTMTDHADGRATEPRVTSLQEHRTLAATQSTLEVGVADGTRGWLKIRAELMDSGAIKAAISSTSTAGQEMLHRELTSLSSFLDQERLPVSSLVVHHTGASAGLYAGADGGSGAASQQPQGDNAGSAKQEQVRDLKPIDESVPEGLLELQPGDLMSSSDFAGGGGWLSVRA